MVTKHPACLTITSKFHSFSQEHWRLSGMTTTRVQKFAREKSCGYLLMIYMNKCEMVKQKKQMHLTQSGKNCAIQSTCLI